jgi:hypothetical protein
MECGTFGLTDERPSVGRNLFFVRGDIFMEFILEGYCGLYCGACPDLLETKAGTAQNKCCGCKSKINNPGWCSKCNLKACAKDKKIEFCFQCNEYPCEKLKYFINDINYPYHKEVPHYMKMIEKEGKDIWLEKMKRRWSCPKCNTSISWWQQSCPGCGEKINGYQKPS